MRVYRIPYSTNVERVALALAFKGLEAEWVDVDPADRSAVRRVSGQDLVPVLEDGGTVVADSPAILIHLEQRHPDPPLYPRDPARRAEMLVFIDWFNRVWKWPPNASGAELAKLEPDMPLISDLVDQMARWLDLFEDLLDGRDHLMGDDFSAADCIAFPFLKYAAGREPDDDERFHRILEEHQSLEGHPRLAAWIARVGARPRA